MRKAMLLILITALCGILWFILPANAQSTPVLTFTTPRALVDSCNGDSVAVANNLTEAVIQYRAWGDTLWLPMGIMQIGADGGERLSRAIDPTLVGVYQFRVAVKNSSGLGCWSSTLQMVLNGPRPGAPAWAGPPYNRGPR